MFEDPNKGKCPRLVKRAQKVLQPKHIKSSLVKVPIEFRSTSTVASGRGLVGPGGTVVPQFGINFARWVGLRSRLGGPLERRAFDRGRTAAQAGGLSIPRILQTARTSARFPRRYTL